jgi:hypothetical protein
MIIGSCFELEARKYSIAIHQWFLFVAFQPDVEEHVF